ncbi:hypothetical protein A33Q_0224 [Indibacter alkaliphilus LW1]|uniref:Outer membrane protein beta-barrel domain-containing protein n=1 Tax=Indibacter alkaliphilus (strain CCUG 57479 / KCTC 22604 / LW1) TaxID=1189612 RepID=S2DS14_INDAL|nr:hypothetical protein [Indibacter alkaliphilus]EPA00056.1 hypothetical protein A33Q_0224 [Indibacter alkaliphilus LW1]
MKRFVYTLILFSIASFSVRGQDGIAGINFNAGFPVGSFQSEVGNQFFPSISLNYLHKLSNTPIYVGGEFGYMLYGTAVERSNNIINGTDQNFRIRRNNNAVNLSAVVRLMPDFGIGVKPFVEGQLGGIHTYTRSKVRENRLTEPLSSGTEVYDWSFLYQLGGGIMVPLEKKGDVFLELRVNYLQTGPMNFLTSRDALYDDLGSVTLNTRNAAFQLLSPSLAIKIML